MEVREVLTRYDFDGANAKCVRGSALGALGLTENAGRVGVSGERHKQDNDKPELTNWTAHGRASDPMDVSGIL